MASIDMSTPAPPPSLLLLPRGPVSTHHHTALLETIQALRDSNAHKLLIVALPLPLTAPTTTSSSSSSSTSARENSSWAAAQATLARFYALLAAVCAEIGMPSESDAGAGSVDVVAVLVSHEDEEVANQGDGVFRGVGWLARRAGGWEKVFWVGGGGGGKEVRGRFEAFKPEVEAGYVEVSGDSVPIRGETGGEDVSVDGEDTRPCGARNKVCLGGAFDHLHPGHKLLLSSAALLVKRTRSLGPTSGSLIVGISADSLLTKKSYPGQVLPWASRAGAISLFISTFLSLAPVPPSAPTPSSSSSLSTTLEIPDTGVSLTCVEITDAFGPTTTDEEIQALVVSRETTAGGKAVNDRREEKGWAGLEMYIVDVLDASGLVGERERAGWEGKISSTEIRRRRAEAKEEER